MATKWDQLMQVTAELSDAEDGLSWLSTVEDRTGQIDEEEQSRLHAQVASLTALADPLWAALTESEIDRYEDAARRTLATLDEYHWLRWYIEKTLRPDRNYMSRAVWKVETTRRAFAGDGPHTA